MHWSETYTTLRDAKEPFIMATVVNVVGSAPRKPGTRLFIRSDGTTIGSVGGGAMEQAVIAEALQRFTGQGNDLLDYTLEEGGCGGEVTIFLERVMPERELIIFGGGHVGHALAAVMAATEFAVRLVESRHETLERFPPPSGVKVIPNDPVETAELLECSPERTHIVMTGYTHELDENILLALARKEFRYLGILGSRTKAKKLYGLMERHSFDDLVRDRIHCPAGLPEINGNRPQEIAVSIAAQILGLP